MRRLVVLFALSVAGCHSTISAVRTRFATERGCPESEVDVTASGGTEYRASGCGQSTTYVCENTTMSTTDARRCAEEDARRPRGPGDRDRATLPPPDPRVPMP